MLWSDPDKDISGWSENDRGVSFTFGPDVVSRFLQKHDMDLICRAHQVVEDGYEFFAKRQLVTLFSAPNYCGEFDNAGAMMSVDETLLCSFQVSGGYDLALSKKKQVTERGRARTDRCYISVFTTHDGTFTDLEAGREEAEVCVWWDQHGQAGHSTAQAKKEG